MITKIILSFVIIATLSVLIVFKAPELSVKIEKSIGMEGFTEFITGFKSTYDKTFTKIPTKSELENTYNSVYSGAIDLKKTFKEGLITTKGKIDSIRQTASGIESSYNDIKNGYNDIQNFVNTNSGKLTKVINAIDEAKRITQGLTNTGQTN